MAVPRESSIIVRTASTLKRTVEHHSHGLVNLGSLALAFAAISVVIWGSGVRKDLALPREPLPLEGASLQGSRLAPAIIIMFSDFQCPFCSRFARDVLPTIKSQYVRDGRAQLAFRHLPLTPLHDFAWSAAVAAVCAGQQEMFWPMHDALFADQKRLRDGDLLAKAIRVGLNSPTFESCITSSAADLAVQRDVEGAASLGLSSTPTVFVGVRDAMGGVIVTRRFDGAVTAKALGGAIEEISRKSERNR